MFNGHDQQVLLPRAATRKQKCPNRATLIAKNKSCKVRIRQALPIASGIDMQKRPFTLTRHRCATLPIAKRQPVSPQNHKMATQ